MREAGRARPAAHRSLGALCALALWAAGCATREPSLLDAGELDRQHDRICRTIAEVVDAADKAFGEPRVEDRERIVRAKVGIKSTLREREPAAWSVPHNLRLPLPALERQVNFFLDLTADTDTENFSHPRAAASEGDASLSATLLARLTDNVDAGGRLVVEALDNAGPELFTRYESRRDPWMFFGEQRVSYKTDNGWGGATAFSVDYQLAGGESFLRLANKATYYEELRRVDLASSLVYRRPIAGGAMLSAETGVGYNPYAGDPAGSGARGAQKDGDETYARVRVVGKLWRPWLEWEIMPGFYYRWEHERPEAWGLDLRLSMIYEAFLRGRE